MVTQPNQPVVTTYPMDQLSKRPEAVRMGDRILLPQTFGRMETEAMAALLIKMCQEQGQWFGFGVATIGARVHATAQQANEGEGDMNLVAFCLEPVRVFHDGLNELREAGAIRVETVGDNDVVYPTEAILAPLGAYLV